MRFRRVVISAVLVCGLLSAFLTAVPGQAQGSQAMTAEGVDAYLQERVRQNRLPGLAAAVIQNGEVIFSKGYGETGAGQGIDADSQFYIGSVTKSFTALAVLQLVQDGRLALDAPVQQYIPWFRVADEAVSAQITIRHLLNHTSGLSEQGDPNASAVTASLEEQARLLRDVKPNAPVGTKFQYYNQNYRLLGYVIEQVSGMAYADYIEQKIFAPLKMNRSTAHPQQADDLVQAYGRMFGFALPRTQSINPGALPSGYLISSAGDMAKFIQAMIDNRLPDGSELLSPELVQEMRSLPAGVDTQYGIGCLVLDGGKNHRAGRYARLFSSLLPVQTGGALGVRGAAQPERGREYAVRE